MSDLPPFHPQTVLADWNRYAPGAGVFRIADASTHIICTGATGSGKSSAPLKATALSYLAHRFGGVVLCSKPDERAMWEEWAERAGRWSREKQTGDLIIFDASGRHQFNFMDWEASRTSAEGGGLTINIVALLDEIAGVIARGAGKAESGGGDARFFEDALHLLNTNLVDLILFAGYRKGEANALSVSLPLMRAILTSAPQSLKEAESDEWKNGPGTGGERKRGACAALLAEAEIATADADEETKADFEECRTYWTQEYPNLSDRTRSIVQLMASMLFRPLITRPLRKLFSSPVTNVTPEDTFSGKVVIVDLSTQRYRLAGRIANLAWKFCYQVASLRRAQPKDGTFLRPTFLWADEYQMFATPFDAEWASVARSAFSCGVFAVQNRESLIRELGNAATVDSLLANMQLKFCCQNTGDTAEYQAKLIGERWVDVQNMHGGISNPEGVSGAAAMQSGGFSTTSQRRFYVEPSRFAQLKRGGPPDFKVECVVYSGGRQFPGSGDDSGRQVPYAIFTIPQKS